MVLFGDPVIQQEKFYHISDIDTIVHTPPNSIIYLPYTKENLDIITYAQQNHIRMALEAHSIQAIIYAHNLGANYIVVNEHLAKDAQKIAENYLFDAKIIVLCDNASMIETMALLGVDGVLFPNGIVKISS